MNNKKIVVAAFGRENRSVYNYLTKQGLNVDIADQNKNLKVIPEGVDTFLGEDAFTKLADYDVIYRSPPVRPDSLPIGPEITSATKLFFDICPAPIIGVTGTKGKGTTASLIAKILEADGKKVHLVGNIGVPALDSLANVKAEDYVVYELSSFQLWDLEKSPHIAVVLMIEPDHLDVHKDMDEYIAAKHAVTHYQNKDDICIHHPTNKLTKKAIGGAAKHIKFLSSDGADIVGDNIVIDENIICNVADVALLGRHNLENICAAVTTIWQVSCNVDAIKSTLKSFKGLAMHLETVLVKDGLKYINDSYSSAPAAAEVAVKSMTTPFVAILGGLDRSLCFRKLSLAVKDSCAAHIILIGEAKNKIAFELDRVGFTGYTIIYDKVDMGIIIEAARSKISKGTILLSPGCPSFDMYRDFIERGEAFNEAVKL